MSIDSYSHIHSLDSAKRLLIERDDDYTKLDKELEDITEKLKESVSETQRLRYYS